MPGSRMYFGTDGVRGVVGDGLTEDLVRRLGFAFARWTDGAPVLIGRDTRGSGPALEAALAEGLAGGGSKVTLGGVLPTPAVALLAAGCGAVVSASHNPPEYNGVKLFAPGGRKLTDDEEREIEALFAEPPPDGEPEQDDTLGERYADLVATRFGVPLDGLRIACDSANGAFSAIAPGVLERLGASVTSIGDAPDGTNINAGCGATHPEALAELVRNGDFDLGVAFDGDGDRLIAVDAAGNDMDGDGILAVLAVHLGVDLVAVTTMTNLGFHKLMAENGIRTVTTDVGDRYVLEALQREGGKLGGEQSGHIAWLDGHTTGDGLVAAVLLARAVVESGRTLADLASALVRFPQAQRNVPVRTKELTPAIVAEVQRLNEELGDAGRVLVRPSGTEPVVRVLAESETPKTAQDLCATIADLVAKDLS
jgi:phosphoglucosamine mutase